MAGFFSQIASWFQNTPSNSTSTALKNPPSVKKRVFIQPHLCDIRCHRCTQSCPFDVLSSYIIPEYKAVVLHPERCIASEQICGLACAKECSTNALVVIPHHEETEKQKASHPATSPEKLWGLSQFYPNEVLANPALQLIALENPKFYQDIIFSIECLKGQKVIINYLPKLGKAQRLLFAADCAERVIPIIERNDSRFLQTHRAIELARIQGEIFKKRKVFSWKHWKIKRESKRIFLEINHCFKNLFKPRKNLNNAEKALKYAAYGIRRTLEAHTTEWIYGISYEPLEAVFYHMNENRLALVKEISWQAARLKWYLSQ